MQIRLDKVGVEPTTWHETLQIDASTLDRVELIEVGEIDWRGRIWVEGPGFPLEARAEYKQSVACVRCLTPIVEDVSSEIRLTVFNRAPAPVEGEIELSEDDLEVLYCPDEVLDTSRILQEQLQLNVPMRAICREECLGLCPVCGKNRNETKCDCEASPADPRWKVLQGLKE
jgi:uncharacterized metal-binding protein YceD (DUF177 family)